MNSNLIQKYNIPGPRYTSYPTVPYWDEKGIDLLNWSTNVKKAFDSSNASEGISLYIHLPFCESLCTFCACHKYITKQHGKEGPYIDTLLKEWDLYCEILKATPQIREIHLGGGTPTFFSSENLSKLINGILKKAVKHVDFELSFEGHPNNTTQEQMQALFDLGSRRVSYGIQDYNPKVQKAIHRFQSYDQVKTVTDSARQIGYTSVSHDLIFGLPFQDEEAIRDTIDKTISLRPDRIAYYSYAHVPWIKGVGQRGFNDMDLPADHEKRRLYEIGKQMFFDNDYVEIGMDHFALKSDTLHDALVHKKLHRNFMGYTAGKTKLMIGLGMSSISDSWSAFAQNEKTLSTYSEKVNNGIIPIAKGHELSSEDLVIRKHILDLMCNLETLWTDGLRNETKFGIIARLAELQEDDLIEIHKNGISVKEEGRMFMRNICMAFDLKLINKKPATQVFSMTI